MFDKQALDQSLPTDTYNDKIEDNKVLLLPQTYYPGKKQRQQDCAAKVTIAHGHK